MFWKAYSISMRYLERLAPQDWWLLLLLVVLWGLFCMRGFGSRSSY
jgi:hypothetical protein